MVSDMRVAVCLHLVTELDVQIGLDQLRELRPRRSRHRGAGQQQYSDCVHGWIITFPATFRCRI